MLSFETARNDASTNKQSERRRTGGPHYLDNFESISVKPNKKRKHIKVKREIEEPKKDTPFNTFRQNATQMAMNETGAYVARIKELEAELKAERSRQTETQTGSNLPYQTPAPFRASSTSTPSSNTKRMDPESLYARNQT